VLSRAKKLFLLTLTAIFILSSVSSLTIDSSNCVSSGSGICVWSDFYTLGETISDDVIIDGAFVIADINISRILTYLVF